MNPGTDMRDLRAEYHLEFGVASPGAVGCCGSAQPRARRHRRLAARAPYSAPPSLTRSRQLTGHTKPASKGGNTDAVAERLHESLAEKGWARRQSSRGAA